jgi:hypothetical protein
MLPTDARTRNMGGSTLPQCIILYAHNKSIQVFPISGIQQRETSGPCPIPSWSRLAVQGTFGMLVRDDAPLPTDFANCFLTLPCRFFRDAHSKFAIELSVGWKAFKVTEF